MSDSGTTIGALFGGGGALLTVLGALYAAIKNRRFLARCCGRQFELEFRVETMRNIPDAAVHPEPAEGATPERHKHDRRVEEV